MLQTKRCYPRIVNPRTVNAGRQQQIPQSDGVLWRFADEAKRGALADDVEEAPGFTHGRRRFEYPGIGHHG